jgi:hypothetical protein
MVDAKQGISSKYGIVVLSFIRNRTNLSFGIHSSYDECSTDFIHEESVVMRSPIFLSLFKCQRTTQKRTHLRTAAQGQQSRNYILRAFYLSVLRVYTLWITYI